MLDRRNSVPYVVRISVDDFGRSIMALSMTYEYPHANCIFTKQPQFQTKFKLPTIDTRNVNMNDIRYDCGAALPPWLFAFWRNLVALVVEIALLPTDYLTLLWCLYLPTHRDNCVVIISDFRTIYSARLCVTGFALLLWLCCFHSFRYTIKMI